MDRKSTGKGKTNPLDAQKFLKGLPFPVNKRGIVEWANASGAPKDVITTLQDLAEREYQNPTDLSDELFGKREKPPSH